MDANDAIYDKRRRIFHIDRYEFAADYLKDKSNDSFTVLDAACGTGYGSDILKRIEPKSIMGIDICSETINYANKKYGNMQCTFKVSDITDMNAFKEKMFDAVVSFETIEHIEMPTIFLENVKRVLKKEGILIISTPNKWGSIKDHKIDYDYSMLKNHLERFFNIEDIYVQNSGSMDLWINRGMPRRLVKTDTENIEQAECFITVCKNRHNSKEH